MGRRMTPEERAARIAALLRLLAAFFFLVFVVAFFAKTVRRAFELHVEPIVLPVVEAVGLPSDADLPPLPPPTEPPAPGFVVSVRSEPAGGTIRINGVRRGPAPAITNVVCGAGEAVTITVEKEGYQHWQRVVPCRDGRLLIVHAQLEAPAAVAAGEP